MNLGMMPVVGNHFSFAGVGRAETRAWSWAESGAVRGATIQLTVSRVECC